VPRHLFVLERAAWLAAGVAALYFLGVGLEHTFQFEPTGEALREEAVGFRMIRVCSLALLGLAGYGWWRGTPTWACMVVLLVPIACGGLSELAPQTLVPHLIFLGAAPLAGLAVLVAAFLPWAVPHLADRRSTSTVR
jgi:hypothetical protein